VLRCDGCGKMVKGAEPKGSPDEQKLAQLQKKQERLEGELTACLMEQAALTKKMEDAGAG
jgi:hypothetical protein